ncbi:hypothetical protein Q3G72_027948 [Acer saccharum]|nr:hypothetical protein Q3G72_027948 [Acer saccharum]
MNKLEGDLSEVGFWSNLVSLQLFENRFSGEVLSESGNFQKLLNLSLYRNKLTRKFSKTVESFLVKEQVDWFDPTRFVQEREHEMASHIAEQIHRSKLSLTGTVPTGIWGLSKMNIIDIAMNQFEGSITKEIRNAKALIQLYAGNNRLSSELPEEISQDKLVRKSRFNLLSFMTFFGNGVGSNLWLPRLKETSSVMFSRDFHGENTRNSTGV